MGIASIEVEDSSFQYFIAHRTLAAAAVLFFKEFPAAMPRISWTNAKIAFQLSSGSNRYGVMGG